MDIFDKIIECEKSQRDMGFKPIARRRKRINWGEVWAVLALLLLAFVGGAVIAVRLTDGGAL